MFIKTRIFGGCLVLSILAACNTTNPPEQIEVPTYPIPDAQQFPEYEEPIAIEPTVTLPVINVSESETIPESVPTSSKNVDTDWVQQQSPAQYTLLIANGTSAASVAMTLHNAPKSAHMAEVKTQNHGVINYLGVYGSYATYTEAQQAVIDLPESMQAGVTIKTWAEIQQSLVV